eukprot:7241580-Ditylum_brightwellii.AAC.1
MQALKSVGLDFVAEEVNMFWLSGEMYGKLISDGKFSLDAGKGLDKGRAVAWEMVPRIKGRMSAKGLANEILQVRKRGFHFGP